MKFERSRHITEGTFSQIQEHISGEVLYIPIGEDVSGEKSGSKSYYEIGIGILSNNFKMVIPWNIAQNLIGL